MSPQLIVGKGTPASAWAVCPKLASLIDVSPAELVPPTKRAVIVTPHPDDEVLGSGGLLALLGKLRRRILVIAVTDGAASYPGSNYWTPERLAATRPWETAQALRRLELAQVPIVQAGFVDGAIHAQEARLGAFLVEHLDPDDVVITTWQNDGHPDHEATGRACIHAAGAVRARVVEVPIWAWHWAAPSDMRIPWQRARKIVLDAHALELKRYAVAAYVSQIAPDSSGETEPILPPHVLARLVKDFEVLLL